MFQRCMPAVFLTSNQIWTHNGYMSWDEECLLLLLSLPNFTEPKGSPLSSPEPFLFTAKREVCPICNVSQALCNEAFYDVTSYSTGHCQGTRGLPLHPLHTSGSHLYLKASSPSPGKLLHYPALLFAADLPNFSRTVHLCWPIWATFWVVHFELHRVYFLSHFLNMLVLTYCYPLHVNI